jgi:hypothetical protein
MFALLLVSLYMHVGALVGATTAAPTSTQMHVKLRKNV